jgi:hypothetical protein
MEFDSVFCSLPFAKTPVRLNPINKKLLASYAEFHAVSADQIINTAIERLFASDPDFVKYVQSSHAKSMIST